MVTPALLESVRTLSIPDKVALIEAVSQMLQRELQNSLRVISFTLSIRIRCFGTW